MKDILCILINHNHNDLLKKNLTIIDNLPDHSNYNILLINNLSDNVFTSWVNKKIPKILVINNNSPQGVSSNVNNAIINYGADYKYYCLINPDVECYPYIFDKLFSYMNENRDVGISAPLLYNLDGSIQYSCRNFPTPIDSIGRAMHLDKFNNNYFKDYLMKKFNHKDILDVNWVTGAFMFIRASAIKEISFFDHKNFFIYCEDIDICRRMLDAGWRIIYNPNAKAIHYYIRAGAKSIFSKFFYYQLKSTLNYYRKYGFNNKR